MCLFPIGFGQAVRLNNADISILVEAAFNDAVGKSSGDSIILLTARAINNGF